MGDRLSDYSLIHAMKPAMRPLTARAGSHTRVYAFDPARLGQAMADLAGEHGADASSRAAAMRAGRALGRRFLLKVGNISDYVVKLSEGGESVFRRAMMSEVFGPVGYDFAPSTHKVHIDSREAVREIPFFAFGPPEAQFAPDVIEDIRRAITGRQARTSPGDAIFLVEEDGQDRVRRRAYDVICDDPYFKENLKNFSDLSSFQNFLRLNPLDSRIRDLLNSFFDAPMTVGFRDVLRWTEGARHPELGWNQAEELIRRCFRRFGTENFLPPEINYYTQSIERSPGEFEKREAGNLRASNAFARLLIEKTPLSWTMRWSDGELFELAEAILRLHFDYPEFEVEPYNGIVSTSGLRMTARVLAGLVWHLSGIDMPDRRNPITRELAAASEPMARFMEVLSGDDRMEFVNIVNDMLWEVAARGGVPLRDGGVAAYRRIERTFYSFQERAQYSVEKKGIVEDVFTLEEMQEGPGHDLLTSHPDVARKLVVFFTLVYRYFLDTGHVPDLRPDDAGRDLLLKGIWGYKTGNLLVVTGRDRRGRPINALRFVDNKDQFKQYKREEDRANPMGLAKYALRLVHPLIQPAMERSIGIYTGMVAGIEGMDTGVTHDIPTRLSRATNQVLREGVDGAMTHTAAFLHDFIDDATEGIQKYLGKL